MDHVGVVVGLTADAADLKALPHDVVFTERLLELIPESPG